MASIQNDMKPVFEAVTDLANSGNCTFLKTNYNSFTNTMCTDMLESLLLASLAMFVVGFCGIFMISSTVGIQIRIAGAGSQGSTYFEGGSATVDPL